VVDETTDGKSLMKYRNKRIEPFQFPCKIKQVARRAHSDGKAFSQYQQDGANNHFSPQLIEP
jgi:hypothetical protein